MVLYGTGWTSNTILAIPDSGSEENIISSELVSSLGLVIHNTNEDQKNFYVANGRVVKALGCVSLLCGFVEEPTRYDCLFYVFKTLIRPLVMGMAFLKVTNTLTSNRHRLQPRSVNGPPRCTLLNQTPKFECIVQPLFFERPYFTILASPDTGSELNLVSSDFCRRHKIPISKISKSNRTVQFADGSLSSLEGQIALNVVTFSRGDPFIFGMGRIEFYILPGLTCDVLFGESTVAVMDIFNYQSYKSQTQDRRLSMFYRKTIRRKGRLVIESSTVDSATIGTDSDLVPSEVKTIVWYNKIEQRITSALTRNSRGPTGQSSASTSTSNNNTVGSPEDSGKI